MRKVSPSRPEGGVRDQSVLRLRIVIRGAVQGVGFRPFVYRLANEMHLSGWVLNSSQGVFIEGEGEKERLDAFVQRIQKEKPSLAFIQSMEFFYLDPAGFVKFEIRPSNSEGEKSAHVLPDIATCPECLAEILDPANRRYLYPFTNCTNCGPRFSIIESLPYDRSHTSMKMFTMCADCQQEYENPKDRRFHAQPNACPTCGPQLSLWDEGGHVLAVRNDALREAAIAIREGRIVALKGIGGFQLVVDARNDRAVRHLRARKGREEKPFALMYPGLNEIRRRCEVSDLEERLLLSPESPIVLLKRRASEGDEVAESVAPRIPTLGVMLPYTPLHHLLLRELRFPVVATSGNLSNEPICTDEKEALHRLRGIADRFLVHDRPVVRHVDDSIVRILLGRELVLRRARGYAPLPVALERQPRDSVLAVGAHLKNTIALSFDSNVFMSQHIGDLESGESMNAFKRAVADFQKLYDTTPTRVVCDSHPDYLSTQFAKSLPVPVTTVQHHVAHVAACMAENHLDGKLLGVAWDGTGLGDDGTIWGGEFLLAEGSSFDRVATFRTFPLPGGEQAIREPRRVAIGLLYEMLGPGVFERKDIPSIASLAEYERRVIGRALGRTINCPRTSSVGRLFDAVASLLDVRQRLGFEGQAAMELEYAALEADTREQYDVELVTSRHPIVLDWAPMIKGILADSEARVSARAISAKFHNTLANTILRVAQAVGQNRVVLSGGCFQNSFLMTRTVHLLADHGIRPYWHQRIPPNDGGIALGQISMLACEPKRQPDQQKENGYVPRDSRKSH
ncbi:MAG: carbamoyltransferase HypF [Ignavibacterium sp.]